MTTPDLPKEEERLLACPFCGATDEDTGSGREVSLYRTALADDWFVRCHMCGVETAERTGRAAAISAWNTRPTPTGERE